MWNWWPISSKTIIPKVTAGIWITRQTHCNPSHPSLLKHKGMEGGWGICLPKGIFKYCGVHAQGRTRCVWCWGWTSLLRQRLGRWQHRRSFWTSPCWWMGIWSWAWLLPSPPARHLNFKENIEVQKGKAHGTSETMFEAKHLLCKCSMFSRRPQPFNFILPIYSRLILQYHLEHKTFWTRSEKFAFLILLPKL